MDGEPPLDCLACGACCHGEEGWVHVDGADDERVESSPELAALVVLTHHGGFTKRSLRMVHGRCAALVKQNSTREPSQFAKVGFGVLAAPEDPILRSVEPSLHTRGPGVPPKGSPQGGPARSVYCSVYDVRPTVCRELAVGSAACHEARRAQGLK